MFCLIGLSQPTFLCGVHVGSRWAKKWALYGIVRRFHNGPMSTAHVGLMQDLCWTQLGNISHTHAGPSSKVYVGTTWAEIWVASGIVWQFYHFVNSSLNVLHAISKLYSLLGKAWGWISWFILSADCYKKKKNSWYCFQYFHIKCNLRGNQKLDSTTHKPFILM